MKKMKRQKYNTEHYRKIKAALPKKGRINVKEVMKETGIPESVIYYHLRTMAQEAILKVKIGIKKTT